MTEVLPLSPQAIAEWMPFARAAGFFFATFILEDVAAIGAGLLLATGQISWLSAFLACFLGIWMGDAGLYALARLAGRVWFERSSLRRFSVKVSASERWFARRGTIILAFSRLVPGARLPTYLAAGFLRVPLPRFLVVTGTASCVWTVAILFLAQTFGEQLTAWFGQYRYGGLLLLGAALGVFATLQLVRRALANIDFHRLTAQIGRWRHWEFWPAWMFYPPVTIYCLWLGVKYRGLTLPTSSNPGMFSGGLVGESKLATLRDLMITSAEFTADAELLETSGSLDQRIAQLKEICARRNFSFPFVLKPDVGQRGAGVKLIRSWEQAVACLRTNVAPLVVQRYAPGPREVGIFYYRFPHERRGHVFAITEKVFPIITGNGRSTVSELIRQDSRARYMADRYIARFQDRADEVLPIYQTLKLVEAGDHAQGCIFKDGMHLFTEELATRIDAISQKLNGFFIGRYDIRYQTEDDLHAGRNFQIVELNGAASEATSLYDARNSLWAAYGTLFRQWELVFAIGAANRHRGCPSTPFAILWRKWWEYGRFAATYPIAD